MTLFEQLVLDFTTPEIQREVPPYLRPRPLSTGEMDWCAKTRDGERCQWARHGDTPHSFDPPERLPAWLAVQMTPAQRQQADWLAWLQDDRGRWRCPACGDLVATAEELRTAHGWTVNLSEAGHPYHYSWPGKYAEGGYSGNGGRCKKLRAEWLEDHYRPTPAVEDVVLSL